MYPISLLPSNLGVPKLFAQLYTKVGVWLVYRLVKRLPLAQTGVRVADLRLAQTEELVEVHLVRIECDFGISSTPQLFMKIGRKKAK